MGNPVTSKDALYSLTELEPHIAGFSSQETGLVRAAAEFAALMHQNEKRASGEPFITHPLEVARLTAELGLGPECIAAALLHDVVENTKTTVADIEERFGGVVAKLVDGLTKIKNIDFSSAHEKQAENFKKLLLEVAADIRIIVIKLVDRLHNIRTLEYLKREKQDRIALETRDIFAPLAYKIGLHSISVELEDGAFKILEPEIYNRMERALEREAGLKKDLISQTRDRVTKALRDNGVEVEIDFRTRGIYQTWLKRSARKNRKSLHNRMHDHHYFQVITDSVRDCYTVLGLLHSLYPPVPGLFKDYIATPKTHYYRSLHSVVLVEMRRLLFQIRTHEMHEQANNGIVTLMGRNKQQHRETGGNSVKTWLEYLGESQQEIANPQEFLTSLKEELVPDEIFVFTPDGTLMSLPSGSTPLDFAFAVHSELGAKYSSAMVNGIEVERNIELETGDCVQIYSDDEATPEEDWLDDTATRKAKKHILKHLKQEGKQTERFDQ